MLELLKDYYKWKIGRALRKIQSTFLANLAVEGGPAGVNQSFDRRFAGRAGGVFFSIDRKLYGEITRFPVTVIEVAQGGASSGDAFLQSFTDTGQEPIPVLFRQFTGFSGRSNSCMVKRFAGINISNPRQLLGIHYERFDRSPGVFGFGL